LYFFATTFFRQKGEGQPEGEVSVAEEETSPPKKRAKVKKNKKN
jgi:hypothetical protein